ncbi:MAG TPA: DHA2 family efflux MFS transporter permease subunit [Burkholderiaceae bacterium]|nr:DHA2 family efflux MFS transporter permease subunit [Burkholderiaceae bacterium]
MTTDAAPHPHSRAGLTQRFGPRYRWLVLLTVMIGTMAAIMASTIVNVAVPDISRVFHLGQERAQWLSAGFMAAMTLSMLTTPWLLQRFGYRHTYIAVVALLLAGGVIGGLSQWFELVLAMRVAEGLAAGVLQPIPAIIVLHAFERHEQGKAMGIFGFGVVLAPAIGPTVGGVLVEWFGWRGVFFVVVPFCLAALPLARRYLPITAPGGLPAERGGARLDVIGLVLVAVAVLSLLNGMVQLHGASRALGGALLACSATALIGFVFHQKRGARPLMELRLFGHANFALGGVVAFIYGMALFGSTYLVPVFMQIALRLPPSQAGAALLPAGIVLALTIPVAGRLTDRLPFGRIVGFGLALLAASFLLMVTVGPQSSLWWIVAWAIIGRIGLGFVLPSLNVGAMRGLPDSFISQGASTINFMRQLGGAVGISLVGIVLEWRLQHHADDAVRAFHETFVLIGLITAVAVAAALRMKAPRAPAAAAMAAPPR